MALNADQNRHIRSVIRPYFGGDPELFLAQGKKIVGSERLIPKGGIKVNGRNGIIRDGVQLELNLPADPCRARLANGLAGLMRNLAAELAKKPELSASFAPVVTVTKDEMAKLSKEAQQLGCAPSLNRADPKATIKVPDGFRGRSAGGHIHIGINQYAYLMPLRDTQMIDLMDILVGNTSVLIDRDPKAAERRKVYGRASEHRLPNHGFEYRTLSNFWLRSYQLMSLMMGMSRLACNVAAANTRHMSAAGWPEWNAYAELMGRVDMKKIYRAINESDLELAKENWVGVRSFLDEHVPYIDAGLDTTSIDAFDFFCEKVQKSGLEYWFKEDPLTHWVNLREGHQHNADGYAGWESFIQNRVLQDMLEVRLADAMAALKAA